MILVGRINSSASSGVRMSTRYTHHGSSPVPYDARVLRPPTFNSLVDDPAYRKYVKTVPFIPESISHGNPWAVWALTDASTRAGKWRGGQFPTYAKAWSVLVKALRSPRVVDVTIVSRRRLFRVPPELDHMVYFPYEWCPRCRRPTMYELFEHRRNR